MSNIIREGLSIWHNLFGHFVLFYELVHVTHVHMDPPPCSDLRQRPIPDQPENRPRRSAQILASFREGKEPLNIVRLRVLHIIALLNYSSHYVSNLRGPHHVKAVILWGVQLTGNPTVALAC